MLSFVNALNKSASIENQIEIIHNIFKCTSTEDDKFELEKYELLIFIYFDVFIKHPAKAVISNLFNNSSKINEPMVIKLLSASIQQVLKNTKGKFELILSFQYLKCSIVLFIGSLEDMNLTVSELNECLQFKLAVEAIRLNDELVLSLANQAMAEYFFEFK